MCVRVRTRVCDGAPTAHWSEQLLSLQCLYESSVFMYEWQLILAVCVCRHLLRVFVDTCCVCL